MNESTAGFIFWNRTYFVTPHPSTHLHPFLKEDKKNYYLAEQSKTKKKKDRCTHNFTPPLCENHAAPTPPATRLPYCCIIEAAGRRTVNIDCCCNYYYLLLYNINTHLSIECRRCAPKA